MKMKNPEFAQKREALETYVQDYIRKGVLNKKSKVIIPVVVHNITHDGGQGYVSKSKIEAQINRLNIDFQRQNSDANQTRDVFKPFAASIDIEFRLAHIDPNGNCTEGIVRIEDPLSYYPVPRDQVKSVSYWPNSGTRSYFNIWIIDEIQGGDGTFVAGYAQFPGNNNNGRYGVVIADQSVSNNERTLTHELGHCLNLYHTFNYSSNDCRNPNDYCSDTPRQDQSYTSQCNLNQNTCSNYETDYGMDVVDQIENYMSYAECQNMFSLDQKTRIEAILSNTNVNDGVAHLASSQNLTLTGVSDPYNPAVCVPDADFEFARENQNLGNNTVYICAGDSVRYMDDSFNAIPSIFDWEFVGGSPSSSSSSSPIITYNTPGVYDAISRPGTSAGSGYISKSNIINVSSLDADYEGIIDEGFEELDKFNQYWRVENVNGGGQTFNRTTDAAASGDASIRILNRFSNTDELHELISPSYDLSSLSNPIFSFKYAFARIDNSNNDRLFVWYSLNCGSKWSLALPPIQGASLSTIGDELNSNVWEPESDDDWAAKYRDLSFLSDQTNVRFKFAFETGGGNNLYIDDINIDGALNVAELNKKIKRFNVYPNPTNASAKVAFQLTEYVDNLSITVKNALGQTITSVVNGASFNSGNYTLNIDQEEKLPSGLYFIEFIADKNVQVQKLIVR
jgi:hypothetical protein